MFMPDLPKVSVATDEIIILDTIREFCTLFFSAERILTSFVLYLVSSRNSLISLGGIKLGSTSPILCNSESHFASRASANFQRLVQL